PPKRRINAQRLTHSEPDGNPTDSNQPRTAIVLHARPGGCLAVIGRAASPSEKTARVNIVPQVREEAKRALRCARRAPARAGCRAVRTARPWRGIVPSTHLAREGRMTVTFGRRELLVALGGAAAAWPLAARAQQPERRRRIGVLMAFAESDHEAQSWIAAFRAG